MKKVISVFSIIGLGILIVYFLNNDNWHTQRNGFTRIITDVNITLKNSIELPDKLFGFAGKLGDKIKLNRYLDHINLYEINYPLNKLDTIFITYPTTFNIEAKNIYKDVLPPFIYCTNPYGDILRFDGKLAKPYTFKTSRFDVLQAISPNSIIVRARFAYNEQKNRSLIKLNLAESAKLVEEYPLPNTPNGFFANDGQLLYDRENSKILYMYFYKGRFLSLDTNLNFLYSSKTIDTVHTAKINTRLYNKKNGNRRKLMNTLSSPPDFVNRYITSNNNKIYILSRLKAENETQTKSAENEIIDVYNINNGSYIKSFYIPKYKGKKLNRFQINKNILVAIYGSSLVTYNFKEQ